MRLSTSLGMVEQESPTTPEAGRIVVYANNNKQLCYKDSTGKEVVIGSATKLSFIMGDSVTTVFTITHNLNTRDVDISIYGPVSGHEVTQVGIVDENSIEVTFDIAPPLNSVRVVII